MPALLEYEKAPPTTVPHGMVAFATSTLSGPVAIFSGRALAGRMGGSIPFVVFCIILGLSSAYSLAAIFLSRSHSANRILAGIGVAIPVVWFAGYIIYAIVQYFSTPGC